MKVGKDIRGGAWCPKRPISPEVEEWLQVEFPEPVLVTAVETQGRFGNGMGKEFAQQYTLSYWRPALNEWRHFKDALGHQSPTLTHGNDSLWLDQVHQLLEAYFKKYLVMCALFSTVGKDIRGGAWCPKRPISPEVEEWLQVEFPEPVLVTAVETQGRFGNGMGKEFAQQYTLSYWRPALNEWRHFKDALGHQPKTCVFQWLRPIFFPNPQKNNGDISGG
ncbi:unnamed protein product [Notodromas monacha]|uniref:F5/8 type C domain-containing protein n=1 Tax=Notodromas monacha TaxID=399045 RepID=A0A7R9GHJ8_9CRUS|nr:unnamed protein product [Notodromas monacha]CAG0922988.1 unnamed protein product [Notodromas monacha]